MGQIQRARVIAASFLLPTLSPAAVAAPSQVFRIQDAVEQLALEGKFSGAVVVRDRRGVRFAKGFGMADPFERRPFTADTPVDSASLAKPVTAAAVLMLERDGKLDLDAPVRRYLVAYPYQQGTVRQLLAHSAGLPVEQMLDPITGKTNEAFLAEMAARKLPPLFPPGSGFVYCNLCYTTLAALIERVAGKPYLQFAKARTGLPPSVTIRPAKLSEWGGRAIGYRREPGGEIVRADSYENELFYGSANLSISARQLADWGSQWWQPKLSAIREVATTAATISGKASGLTWGNWYCAKGGRRCHYLGHHEGFHHMLYWDRDRRISVAMVSNNSLAAALQQRLQRALVASASGQENAAAQELSKAFPDSPVTPGKYEFPTGEVVNVVAKGNRVGIVRGGLTYLAFKAGGGIRYVPGLDVYVAGGEDGRLHWLSLYEDMIGAPAKTLPKG